MKPCYTIIYSIFLILLIAASRICAYSAHEYEIRDGCPNTKQKLQNSDTISIVFIGGSITNGSGYSGYVFQVPKWLREQYPNAVVTTVNAGLPGTNSELGSYRYDAHVLEHDPDLVFIEFNVNDGGRDSRDDIERMVRKTWIKDAKTDIVLLYTFNENHLGSYAAGNFPTGANYHEDIAKYYKIPSAGISTVAAQKINSGELEADSFFNDGVHPSDLGNRIYAEATIKAMQPFLDAGTAGDHPLPEKTFVSNLVVNLPEPIAQPLPDPAPLSAGGKTADKTWQVPVFGKHWVLDPQYKIDNQVRWQLFTLNIPTQGKKLDKTVGADRTRWGGLMRWVYKYFEGPDGYGLALSYSGSNRFLSRENTSAILTFIAPKRGRYVVQVSADGAFRNETYQEMALNCLHFKPGNETSGESKALGVYKRGVTSSKISLEFEVITGVANEIIAFVSDIDLCMVNGGEWRNFDVKIGLFEDLDAQQFKSAFISPENSTVLPTKSMQCQAKGLDQYNAVIDSSLPVTWSTDCADCKVDNSGLFTAGQIKGEYWIKAKVGANGTSYSCSTRVYIRSTKEVFGKVIGYGQPIPFAFSYEVALDGNTETFPDMIDGPTWVGYDFEAPTLIAMAHVWPRDGWSQRMKDMKFEVSDDGETWKTVHTIKEQPAEGAWTTIVFNNPAPAKMIRYNGTGGYLNVGEIKFYEALSASDIHTLPVQRYAPRAYQIHITKNASHILVRCAAGRDISHMTLYAMDGALLYKSTRTSLCAIPKAAIAAGTYVLAITSKHPAQRRTRKLVLSP